MKSNGKFTKDYVLDKIKAQSDYFTKYFCYIFYFEWKSEEEEEEKERNRNVTAKYTHEESRSNGDNVKKLSLFELHMLEGKIVRRLASIKN